jgi:hypothetical protein
MSSRSSLALSLPLSSWGGEGGWGRYLEHVLGVVELRVGLLELELLRLDVLQEAFVLVFEDLVLLAGVGVELVELVFGHLRGQVAGGLPAPSPGAPPRSRPSAPPAACAP